MGKLAKSFFTLYLALLSITAARAQNYEYPELLVAPSASERIKMEAVEEQKRKITTYSPFLVSGAMTAIAGLSLLGNVKEIKPAVTQDDKDKNSEAKMAPYIGIGVGLSWIAASYIMSNRYRPYYQTYNETYKLPTSTKEQKLARERLAEEGMKDAASTMRALSWFSFVTNAGASAVMSSKADDNKAKMMATLSAVVSLAPLIVKPRWVKTYNQHQEYKKKIYGPINVQNLLFEPESRRVIPGVMVSFQF
ncbi:MAG: hypothetical protein JNM93_00915 [Bacteriovoracaceae bacterium]|nr:hypothetical protein [Bacteriovoracaceae bacterium]